MAINNCICENCDHSIVCEIYKKRISVFSDEARNPLGVDIRLENCTHYTEVEE